MCYLPRRSRTLNGFSLIEAVLASFLLLTAIALSVYVFDSSLQAEAGNEKRVTATLVAECAFAEIRQQANKSLGQVKTDYDGKTWTVAEYPDFQIRSKVRSELLAIPCTVLEESQYAKSAVYPDPEGRFLRDSSLRVELTVSWDDRGSQSVTVSEIVTSFTPVSNFSIRLLLPGGGVAKSSDLITLARQEKVNFSAQAFSDSQRINDITFTWFVEAVEGFGSLDTVSRDTSRCTYINMYRNFENEPKFSPGVCFLVVKASYQGMEDTAKVRIKNES